MQNLFWWLNRKLKLTTKLELSWVNLPLKDKKTIWKASNFLSPWNFHKNIIWS